MKGQHHTESATLVTQNAILDARRPCIRPPECIRIGNVQHFDRITWNPNQMNGQPCIRGMRLTVRRVLEALALYPNRDDLFRNYPELEPDDLQQALAFAAANSEPTFIPAGFVWTRPAWRSRRANAMRR